MRAECCSALRARFRRIILWVVVLLGGFWRRFCRMGVGAGGVGVRTRSLQERELRGLLGNSLHASLRTQETRFSTRHSAPSLLQVRQPSAGENQPSGPAAYHAGRIPQPSEAGRNGATLATLHTPPQPRQDQLLNVGHAQQDPSSAGKGHPATPPTARHHTTAPRTPLPARWTRTLGVSATCNPPRRDSSGRRPQTTPERREVAR